jgi:broad specificity phosphatase PhoE
MASPKKITLYIVRHGESRGNVERKVFPAVEDYLTDKGKQQAIALGQHLKDVVITRAYSSDYSRTLETAKLVIQHQSASNALGGEDITLDKRLRERDLGVYEGLTYREALLDVIKSKVHVNKLVIPQAETFDAINARADAFFKEVLTEAFDSDVQNETILAVTHALFMNRVMLYLEPDSEYSALFDWKVVHGWETKCQKVMTNASYMQLEATKGEGGKVHLTFLKIHERNHLLAEDQSGGNDLLRKFIEANPEGQFLSSCLQV